MSFPQDAEIPLTGATLATIVDGELERSFQDDLARFVEITDQPGMFEVDKEGTLVCKVTCEIELGFNYKTQTATIGARTKFRDPKRVRSYHAAFVKAGALMIQPSEQTDLFSKVRPIVGGRDD